MLLRGQDGLRSAFQTGYLTIDSVRRRGALIEYRLRWPNLEVYASVFYAYFASLGLDIVAEESSNAGRLDMAVRFNGQVYLFEFKVVELEPDGRALQQIKDRGYADKYRGEGMPIHLIGIAFSRERRGLAGFEVESLATA